GGDGFFLWAGNTSMDTGAGGANDNVLYGNDWSHAPTNGIESTFSRNFFVNNLIMECWHGIWGGYSFENQVIGNVFALNAEAIAWEHGNNNLVMHNLFHRDLSALAVWSNPTEGDWPYANNRNTESRGWFVHNNVFEEIPDNALNVRGTEDFLFYNNTLSNVAEVFDMETDRVSVRAFGEGYGLDFSNFVFTGNQLNASTLQLPETVIAQNNVQDRAMPSPAPMTMNLRGEVIIDGNWDLDAYMERFEAPIAAWNPWKEENPSPDRLQIETWAPEPLEDGIDPFLGMDVPRGRRMILIDEWGPIDFFNTPTLFPRTVEGMLYTEEYAAEREGSNTRVFEVLGPDGEWEVTELRGVLNINKRSGTMPDVIEVEFDPQAQDIGVVIEYTGEQDVFDYRGIVTPAGQPFEIEWSDFRLPIDWQVEFWNWDVETQHPEENEAAFMSLIESEPIYTTSTEELNYNWGAGPIAVNLPADHFATLAVGEIDVEPGTYTLSITSDDGVRVWVDGEMIIDEWQWQSAALFERELELSGQHEIRILHFEIDGGATLKAMLEPAN
ncbi:MAG: PA14 domain-containing protein, partial [Fimbriimonadaceae bacterium]